MSPINTLFSLVSMALVASAAVVERNALESRSVLQRRVEVDGYTQVFAGTGTEADDRDASVKGEGYLTFKVVPDNGTYNVPACIQACDANPKCLFVNLYYEYNVKLVDANGKPSKQKCALYSEVHNAGDKTNFGGQSLDAEQGETYIQDSTGWAKGAELS